MNGSTQTCTTGTPMIASDYRQFAMRLRAEAESKMDLAKRLERLATEQETGRMSRISPAGLEKCRIAAAKVWKMCKECGHKHRRNHPHFQQKLVTIGKGNKRAA